MSQDINGTSDTSGYGSNGVYSGTSDARLTELLRTNSPTAYPALQEIRARHRASVLVYARLCTTSDSAARQLVAEAFTTAAQDTARGTEPGVPWRHRLLLLTAELASIWATDERAAGLDANLLLVLNTLNAAGGVIPTPPMLAPFQSLPSRAQGLIWYGVLEREGEERTADFLGLTRKDVTPGTESALQALSTACLRSRLAASDDPRCQDFRRLIEESVRPVSPRHSSDLRAHMTHCPHCTTAYEELSALRDTPRTVLAEGLLPWSGTMYARDTPASPYADPLSSDARWPWSPPPRPPRPSRRRLVLASAVLGVTLVPLLMALLSSGDGSSSPQDVTGTLPVTTTPNRPEVTVTATVSSSPSAARSPSPPPTSRPPTTPASPPKPTPTPTPTPVFRAPGATFTQVVNVASGRCLDIRDGVLEKGTDVFTAPCSASARTQRWRVDADLRVLQSAADTDFCLDSRGDLDRGVGIWECSAVNSDNGDNLRFDVSDDGVIRPAIALSTALTPDGDGELALVPLTGGSGQRWRAGAA